MKIFFFLLFVFLSVNSWSACSYITANFNPYNLTCDSWKINPSSFPCGVSSIAVSGLPTNCGCSNTSVGVVAQTCTQNKVVRSCTATTSSCYGVTVRCEVCDSDDPCTNYQNECQEVGGTFRGTTVSDNGQSCCRASCNVCNSGAMDAMYQAKSKICCQNGQAPPDKNQTCMTIELPTSGCGMVYSSYGDFTSGGWQCSDPSSSFAAGDRYGSQCLNKSSSSGAGSSSGGSSSGAGECPECDILEQIRDTLISQKSTVENIYSCLTSPFLCNKTDSLPEWVKQKMDMIIDFDSTIANSNDTIKALTKRLLSTDSALLANDTTTRVAIANAALTVDSSITVASDSITNWLNYIADSLHVSTRYLIHHLDSIRSRIPNEVLDSILKYQKTALDDFDSAFYGSNSGFKKIDNLIDSAVKYFQEGLIHDSIYYANYGDSLGAIHGAIENLSGSIEGVSDKILSGLGYGDTASSTLRDELRGYFTGASVDTGSVGFGSSWVSDGERMGDSIGRAVGWIGGLDGVDLDSVFHAGGFDSLAVDSVSASVDDSLSFIADSLNNILVAQNDSIKRGLPDSLSVWADSLVSYSPFASFDSLIFGQLGAKIPNSNQCPENCQKWTINLPRFGLFAFEVDYGLCLGRAPLGGMNALSFIRLLLRIVVVWSCIWIVFNALTRRKD